MATTKFEKPVGSETFELQQQVSSLTTKVGNVGNTDLQTQVTTLNSNLTEANTETNRTIVTTLTNGTPYSDYGGCWYRKYGNHVYVHLGIQGLTANTPQSVFKLPSDCVPYDEHVAFGVGGLTYTAISRISVRQNGNVNVTSDDQYCMADFEFVIRA